MKCLTSIICSYCTNSCTNTGTFNKKKAVEYLSVGLKDKSVLLKREICYILGQIGEISSLPLLEGILKDKNENTMVRHEAAEAIGAIGSKDSIPLLKLFLDDSIREVRETCYLALKRIETSTREECISNEFLSVDPTPSYKLKKYN